MNRRQPKNVMQ